LIIIRYGNVALDSTLLENLSETQRLAALHKEGPLVVFAGAGSGKTRIITTRIACLIEEGVNPWQILAVTFTNKAADEMKQRVRKLCFEGNRCHIGTFHSLCARWLREFSEELGFKTDFIIYDDSDSDSALKKIVKEVLPDQDLTQILPGIKFFIRHAKLQGVVPSDAESRLATSGYKIPTGGVAVYKRYQEFLASCNAMDFGDLILNALLLLRRNKAVRAVIQQRYRYVLVDEFQDTNPAQLELVKLICEQHRNLFVVGDDDQSIYSWRGANPSNIVDFDKIYPDTKKYTLAENFRSTRNIVAAASEMIAHNKYRYPKELYSNIPDGEPISFKIESDGMMEAFGVIDDIKKDLLNYDYSDIAIFYRTNSQSRLFEEALRGENIPYRLYGAVKFYERQEVKDVMAYIRLLVNEDDDISLKRIINLPTRGIGQKAISELEQVARQQNLSMMKSIKKIVGESSSKLSKKLSIFLGVFHRVQGEFLSGDLATLVPAILDVIDYKDYLAKKFPDKLEDKVENLHELTQALTDYNHNYPDASLSDWLQLITLVREGEDAEDETLGVSLMTLHVAKGLEFKSVYVVGVEDGLIPHRNNIENESLLEEERRLFYVGMTRAREKLSLYCAHERMVFNQHYANEPSQFLKCIPPQYLSWEAPAINVSDDVIYEYDQDSSEDATPSIGARVSHPTYGVGVLEGVEDNFGKTKAIVRFFEFGRRKVSAHQIDIDC